MKRFKVKARTQFSFFLWENNEKGWFKRFLSPELAQKISSENFSKRSAENLVGASLAGYIPFCDKSSLDVTLQSKDQKLIRDLSQYYLLGHNLHHDFEVWGFLRERVGRTFKQNVLSVAIIQDNFNSKIFQTDAVDNINIRSRREHFSAIQGDVNLYHLGRNMDYSGDETEFRLPCEKNRLNSSWCPCWSCKESRAESGWGDI